MRVVLVIWHDAHGDADSWTDIDDLGDDGPCVVSSAGLLLKTGRGGKPGHVSIAQSITSDGSVDSVLHIPQAMVVETRSFDKVKAIHEQRQPDRKTSTDRPRVSAPSNPERVDGS